MKKVIEKFITNYNRKKVPLIQLKAIIIHWTANERKGANALRHFDYFNHTKEQRKKANLRDIGKEIVTFGSAHYVVDSESIYQYIPDNEFAYHVGAKSYNAKVVYTKIGVPRGSSPNYYTIGIEMCVNSDGDFTKTRQNTIELTHFLLEKYHLTADNVYRHFDITGKDCPKMMLDQKIWEQFLTEVKNYSMNDVRYRVNVSELNVRTGSATSFPIKRKLRQNETVVKIGQEGVWFKIGTDEWIHSNYVVQI